MANNSNVKFYQSGKFWLWALPVVIVGIGLMLLAFRWGLKGILQWKHYQRIWFSHIVPFWGSIHFQFSWWGTAIAVILIALVVGAYLIRFKYKNQSAIVTAPLLLVVFWFCFLTRNKTQEVIPLLIELQVVKDDEIVKNGVIVDTTIIQQDVNTDPMVKHFDDSLAQVHKAVEDSALLSKKLAAKNLYLKNRDEILTNKSHTICTNWGDMSNSHRDNERLRKENEAFDQKTYTSCDFSKLQKSEKGKSTQAIAVNTGMPRGNHFTRVKGGKSDPVNKASD